MSLRFSLGRSVERRHVALGHVGHEHVAAAGRRLDLALEHDLLERRHLVGPEGQRAVEPHLDAGPAVVVVAGRHHGHAFDVELELGEVGHRRQRETDVVHLRAAGQQADHEGLLHGGRIGAVVVADHEALGHPAPAGQGGETQADGIEPHQVDLLGEQPARVVLAKAGRLDERKPLELGRVGLQVGARLGQHG